MKIRTAVCFALLLCVALILPGTVFGSDATDSLSQTNSNTPTVLAVVRNQGTQLHDRPDGEPFQSLVGGTLVTARLRSRDLKWVLVATRDESVGWVEVRTLLAAGLSRLPIEQPTPTPTATSEPTVESSPTPLPAATATSTATEEPEPPDEANATPTATGTPDGTMAAMTPEATGGVTPEAAGEVMTETGTPEPAVEATPEATAEAEMMEPTATPFVPPEGPTALALARIDGANLWQNDDGAFVAHFEAGKRLTAAYRTEESEWFFVFDDDGVHGWVSADELLVVGADTLPVMEFLSDPTTEEVLEKVVVTVNTGGVRLNVRAGPGTDYDIVARAVAGVEFNAIGRTEASDWVQVAIADLPSGHGWVSALFVTVAGSLEQLPVVEEEEDETTEDVGSGTEEGSQFPLRVHLLPFTSHSTTTIV